MQFLVAERLGPSLEFPRGETAAVLGVYNQGATAVDSAGGLYYLTDKNERGPFHLYIPGILKVLDRICPGQTLCIDPESISLPELGIFIDLRISKRWLSADKYISNLSLETNGVDHLYKAIQLVKKTHHNNVFYTSAVSVLNQNCQYGGQPEGTTITACKNLAKSIMLLDPSRARKAARYLLGRGAGLTPSGDDMLCGWLATLYLLQEQSGIGRNVKSMIDPVMEELTGRTNKISSSLLWAASNGEVNGALLECISQLGAGYSLSANLMNRLCDIGHSSGLDGLVGVLLALFGIQKFFVSREERKYHVP